MNPIDADNLRGYRDPMSKKAPARKYATPAETAARWDVSRQYVHKLLAETPCRIPGVKVLTDPFGVQVVGIPIDAQKPPKRKPGRVPKSKS